MQVTVLKMWRTSFGTPAKDVAEAAGITRTVLCDIERGKVKPHAETKRRISDAMGLSIECLFPEDPGDE